MFCVLRARAQDVSERDKRGHTCSVYKRAQTGQRGSEFGSARSSVRRTASLHDDAPPPRDARPPSGHGGFMDA